MSNRVARISLLSLIMCLQILIAPASFAVGKWERTVVDFPNSNYSGNPFEIAVDAQFTHTQSGTQITLPAYYAGNDTWKVGFMPTRTGTWTYQTSSANAQLDNLSGSVECTNSGKAGMLAADPSNPRKWKLADGDYIIPIALRLELFFEDSSAAEWQAAVDFLVDEVGAHLFDTRLQDEGSTNMDAFVGNPSAINFDLAVWDRMEARMDSLAAKGAGAYIMFYADGSGTPQWSGQSYVESMLIRYAVARLSGYPIVLWDTGIDISEYRSQSDINWFGDQVRGLDPYDHPISSRVGGGSGSLEMSGRTYESRGDRQAYIDDMTGYFNSASRPVAMADSWGENRPSKPDKNFQPEDIRRAAWKAIMAGGLAAFMRGSDGYYHISNLESDLESEQWLRHVNPFVANRLGSTFGEMVPTPSLVSNGHALADPSREKMLFYSVGSNDSWDSGPSGSMTLQLSGVSGDYTATWFDPRTGNETSAGVISGGSSRNLSPPSQDDWVLLLSGSGSPPPPPPPPDPAPKSPTGLRAD